MDLLAAGLDVALALDDVQDLASLMSMPVIAGSCLEPDDANPDGVGIGRHVERVAASGTGEMGPVHWLAHESIGAWGDLHKGMVER